MSTNNFYQLFIMLLISSASFACGIDVSIQEGDTIRMCQQNLQTINASVGYVNYSWYGAGTASSQNMTPTIGGWYYMDATDGVACVSTDSIFVIINADPSPIIQSSEGTNLCPGSTGTNLSLTSGYTNYVWSTSETTSNIQVTDQGNYSVLVTDANGCSATATIQITITPMSIQAIGGNTICPAGSVALQATGGGTYLWSTGETGSLIVVSPTATSTAYTCTITQGTCTSTVFSTINLYTVPPYELPDTLFYSTSEYKAIEAPEGFINYLWSPAEWAADSVARSTAFVGEESGMISVSGETTDGCPLLYSVYVVIVDLTIPEGFSPNNDLINDTFFVPELENIQGHVYFWNRWGDLVFESKNYQNDWDGKCKAGFCIGNQDLPEGTYYYLIDVHDVKFDGFITLKR